MRKKQVQTKLAVYEKTRDRLTEFTREHPEIFEELDKIIEEYNTARAALEGEVRSLGTKVTVGPFSAGLRKNTQVDIDTITLAYPKLLLEPGVVTKVDTTKLRDVAARHGLLAKVEAAVSEGNPTITISKGEAKELVFSWPER